MKSLLATAVICIVLASNSAIAEGAAAATKLDDRRGVTVAATNGKVVVCIVVNDPNYKKIDCVTK